MSNDNQIQKDFSVLPINPEDDPPKSLAELEKLINMLQLKSLEIKHQLEINLPEDEIPTYGYVKWAAKAKYAMARTNHSISALQRIARSRKNKEAIFQSVFTQVAREKLTTLIYASLEAEANKIIAAMN